ncbi:MAG: PilZ domain-containing protein [Lachnospiraceae bacterium]|jgi:hypothetical protein|nr:PilZ domain-containing protein [Lachnospiraceae bacterium]
MDIVINKRDYVRTNNFSIDAKISQDGKDWSTVKVPNIAAGGLIFLTDKELKVGETLDFELRIDPRIIIVIPLNMKFKGVIKSDRGPQEGKNMYAVVYTEISSDDQIRLDELVRLTISRYGEAF